MSLIALITVIIVKLSNSFRMIEKISSIDTTLFIYTHEISHHRHPLLTVYQLTGE